MSTTATPLVSVLVPLYNHARYITRCLDSVLEDGYPNIEIIIIDDGSKDDSAALARQWFTRQHSASLKHFEFEDRQNKGVTRTLNELVGKANGEYLILLASDDYLLPGGISARLEYLEQHPTKFAVFGDCIVVDDSGSKTHDSGIADLYNGHLECLVQEELLPMELIFKWCVPGPVFMARKELYDQIGLYDESLRVEDWDMYLRIAARNQLGFITTPVAAYRYHGGNSVLNDTMKSAQLDSLLRTAEKNIRAFRGAQRRSLLYKYFKLKKDMAAVQGRIMTGLVCRIAYKLLYWVSFRNYKKIVNNLDAR